MGCEVETLAERVAVACWEVPENTEGLSRFLEIRMRWLEAGMRIRREAIF